MNLTVSWLLTARLPEVTINKETSAPEVNLEKRRELQIHKHLVSASFCIFDEYVCLAIIKKEKTQKTNL